MSSNLVTLLRPSHNSQWLYKWHVVARFVLVRRCMKDSILPTMALPRGGRLLSSLHEGEVPHII